MEKGDGLAAASCACQGQIFDVRLAIPVVGRAVFERSFEFACYVQVKYVGDSGVIGRIMLHFEPGALIRGRAENSEVPVTQSQIGESAGFRQQQGLVILANVGEPKLTVGALVILEVFYGPIGRI